jgi:hypothetical protein
MRVVGFWRLVLLENMFPFPMMFPVPAVLPLPLLFPAEFALALPAPLPFPLPVRLLPVPAAGFVTEPTMLPTRSLELWRLAMSEGLGIEKVLLFPSMFPVPAWLPLPLLFYWLLLSW